LTSLVGLSDQVELHHGSALELPFEDESFDVVWTEHVQMNIADKHQFYSEIARALKPGGRFLFHDVFRGTGDSPFYPVPWAEKESISFLALEVDARAVIEDVGLSIEQWNVKVEESLEFFIKVIAKIEADGPPPLGIHLLMGDNEKDKLQNYIRNLSEDRTSVAMGLAHKM
jgi:ubiquinone/menaquinone biosynthesis C-methylase UbiE